MTGTVEFTINGSADPERRYVTWTPYPAQVRLLDADAVKGSVEVRLRNAAGNVGRLGFRSSAKEETSPEMTLSLPATGQPVDLLLSGEFGAPSVNDGDAVLEIVTDTGDVLSIPFMVRIRKDAEALTSAERDRFLRAMAMLNSQGAGSFRDFYAMHIEETVNEAHGRDAFLPWHRAYLLDLERELQRIDPSVALPYWRFDQPAPKLFDAEFLGAPAAGDNTPRLSPANPLNTWRVDGAGIARRPKFADPRTSAASHLPGQTVHPERPIVTLDLDYAYEDFPPAEESEPGFRDILEGNPHGAAHISFTGHLQSAATAAADPLFFLLHCNVDRLWAKWQWFHHRLDPTQPATYFYRGKAGDARATRVGHNALDTMWPWNNVTGGQRPATAPRQPLRGSPVVDGPPSTPTVADMVDYQAQVTGNPMGFDYDDVPFEQT